MPHEITGLTQGFHLFQLRFVFAVVVIHVKFSVTLQGGTIDTHGQRLQIAQVAQLNLLGLVRNSYTMVNCCCELGPCQLTFHITQPIGTTPITPSLDGVSQECHFLSYRTVLTLH